MRVSDIEAGKKRFLDEDNPVEVRGARKPIWHGLAMGGTHFLVNCGDATEARKIVHQIYQDEVSKGSALPADEVYMVVPTSAVNKKLNGILGPARQVVEVPNVITAVSHPESLILKPL